MQRQRFTFATDTGTESLVAGPINGSIEQIGWQPSDSDTGSSLLELILCPTAQDTGGGFVVFSKAGLADAFLNSLVNTAVDKDASDTGVTGTEGQYVGAGDHLVARVTPHGASLAGELLVWIDN